MSYFTFEPKNEEELIELLAIGNGTFEVLQASEEVSKNNNRMIKLILKVWDENGQQGQIFDYLILNENKFSLRKIRHFCYSVGLENIYAKGKLDISDCENKSGNLMIGIQKDKNGQYPDKNFVNDYIFLIKDESNKTTFNDDIPFN
jgi:hypothetical protein